MILNSLKKFRNKLLGINELKIDLEKQLNKNSEVLFYQVNETKASIQLKEFFPEKYFPTTSFSLDFQLIQHIINDIIYFKPKTILEFGTGISTVILNNFIRKNGLNTQLFSIDNDREWQKFVEKYVIDSPNIQFFCFPISEVELKPDGPEKWYIIPEDHLINSLSSIDFVIVDAPFGGYAKKIRGGVLNFLKDKLSPNSILFFDDTNRSDEKEIAENAAKEFEMSKIAFFKYTRLSKSNDFSTKPNRLFTV